MWPFNTAQERQAEAMSAILAENAYDRRMERAAWTVKSILAFFIGVSLSFFVLLGLEVWGDISPHSVWKWIRGE
tara:strand:+ start:1170 stop:1391 length:222 start_codon:yes stop_codon:yes gene_type:complete